MENEKSSRFWSWVQSIKTRIFSPKELNEGNLLRPKADWYK